jgi:predicted MFS family arabinose efflux permease
VFLVSLPAGILTFIFGLIFLREHKEPRPGAFDLPGFVLSAGGLALILFALSSGPSRGWGSPVSWGTGVAGLAAFSLLVYIEMNKEAPMLKFRLISDRLFRTAMLASTFSTGAFLGLLFLMPQFLQQARGVSALQSGLTTFPEAIGVLCGSQIAGRVYLTIGPRRLMAGGLMAVTAFLVTLTRIDIGTSLWVIRILMFCVGASMSFVFIPLQASVFARIRQSDMGNASAIYNAQRQVASALGVAVLATALALALPGGNVTKGSAEYIAGQVSAFHDVFLLAAGLAFVGAIISLFIKDSDAAATMRPRQVVVSNEAAAAAE